ncbi:hypothetical protein CPB97_002668 [Podila verticillata]|nr:hypothetical protein CPB97_002668 [Podila verticillata]
MTDYVAIPGSDRSLLPNSRPAGPINLSEVVTITVRMRSGGDIEALEQEVNELSNRRLEDRTYLTVEQLVQQYGARAEDMDLVEKSTQPPTGDPFTADGEVMLDIEVAGAVVPKANFAVYFAPNIGNKGFLDVVGVAIYDAQCKPGIVSISWGLPEDYVTQTALDAFHEMFLHAAMMGITICVASGDHGTAYEDLEDWDGEIHVNHPAADPSVLSCGSTQIDKHGNNVVWNGSDSWAGGSGISKFFSMPSYQPGASLPLSIAHGDGGRGIPDIAMNATNYYTRVGTSQSASGGTSTVAPLMAALVTRLNQAKQKRVGFLNPFLYTNGGGVVHDVEVGNNAYARHYPGYEAGPGWDA